MEIAEAKKVAQTNYHFTITPEEIRTKKLLTNFAKQHPEIKGIYAIPIFSKDYKEVKELTQQDIDSTNLNLGLGSNKPIFLIDVDNPTTKIKKEISQLEKTLFTDNSSNIFLTNRQIRGAFVYMYLPLP